MLNFRISLLLALAASMGASRVGGQVPAHEASTPAPIIVAPTGKHQNKEQPPPHHFWDKKNDWLFAGVGAARTFDYFSTLNLRRRGDQEVLVTNDVVDNHAAFAVVEAAGTGVSMGTSYLFHRYGHHKLERWTSIVHFGLATTGAVRNYCLKTAHPKTTP
ncbi:MAG: hypothetical protein DMG56_20345 [Acidobacteria bacterium]|nr:MAG: hypothetical protein DMG54_18405 [Acidobacteriota bacterium]PYU58518.1 MAG: hypothetical protein DMG56_20345 [Acidobacteriota bacterium]PYU72439.1 MAG: hypothetical protein DMG52_19175 [Acidobacteriota bacterium]